MSLVTVEAKMNSHQVKYQIRVNQNQGDLNQISMQAHN